MIDYYAELARRLMYAHPGARFGQVVDLATFMGELNNDVVAFDDWVRATSVGNVSYRSAWARFVYADPPNVNDTRPDGWAAFYATAPPGENDTVRRAAEAYEREFVRFYDMAPLFGAQPPFDRRTPATSPYPETPAPPEPGPVDPPPSPPNRTNGKPKTAGGFGVGVLFILAGAALFIAGKTQD